MSSSIAAEGPPDSGPASAADASPPVARIPLTGADCFLRAFDAETRRFAQASHLSQLVLRLGAGFDAAHFERTVAAVAQANPIIGAPVRRRALLGAPGYDLARSGRSGHALVSHHDGVRAPLGEDGLPPIPALFRERLNACHALRKGEHLRFDLVEYPDGPVRTDLAMTWSHMLLDGNGSERFVERLAAVGGGGAPARIEPARGPASPPLPMRERGQLAREWLDGMNAFAQRPPHSLAGPRRKVRQALRYDVLTLDAERTARVQQRAREIAGFMTPVAFYIAATIRAHDAVFRARGVDPGSYVIPLPVNLRPKGAEGEIFQTRIAMIWFQVMPEEVADFEALVASIKQQRMQAIKNGGIERGGAAMDFIRPLPTRLYAYMARNTFRGELASFLFAFTDAFLPGMDDFFAAPILNGFHAPSVTPSPGSSAIMSLRGDRLNVAHVRQEGVFDAEALALFRSQLVADLEGDAP
jgi:hypothetical protein